MGKVASCQCVGLVTLTDLRRSWWINNHQHPGRGVLRHASEDTSTRLRSEFHCVQLRVSHIDSTQGR